MKQPRQKKKKRIKPFPEAKFKTVLATLCRKELFATWFLKDQQGTAWQRYKHNSSHALRDSMANPWMMSYFTSHPVPEAKEFYAKLVPSLKDFFIITKINSIQLPSQTGLLPRSTVVFQVPVANLFNRERNSCFQSRLHFTDDSRKASNTCKAQPADPKQVIWTTVSFGKLKVFSIGLIALCLKSKNKIPVEFNGRRRQPTSSLMLYTSALKTSWERTKTLQ